MATLHEMAPLFTSNWPLLCVALLVIAVCSYYAATGSQANNSKASGKKQSNGSISSPQDKEEHPLSEFTDEKPDLGGTPPSLHEADNPHIPFTFDRLPEKEMKEKSLRFYNQMNKRRSVRFFSRDPIPDGVLENVIRTAGTAPSGAHCEPWTFVVVRDSKLKTQIREIVEQEEYTNYDRRMGDKWVQDLKFVKTDHVKPYLEDAPAIVLVMKQQYHIDENSVKHPHYYFEISTAIAAGILIAAIHVAGLGTVTTTPLNAGVALRELLGRPNNEKVMLLLPVGYPAEDAKVPDLSRKPLEDIMVTK